MIPLPGGITSTFLNDRLVQSMKWKRSSLRRSSMARFLAKASRIEAAAFHGQRVVDDQLHRHHRIHLGRIAALLGDGIAQAGQVDQRGLAEDVVADHARREPREIEVAAAFDQLQQIRVAQRRVGTRHVGLAHDVLGMHAGGVGQRGVGARAERVDGGARVEPVEMGAGERFAEFAVHPPILPPAPTAKMTGCPLHRPASPPTSCACQSPR